MITDALIRMLFAVPQWLVGELNRIPFPDLSGVIARGSDGVSRAAAGAAQLGAWIPWDVAGIALAVVLGSLLAAVSIRLVRIVASFLTLGGGA